MVQSLKLYRFSADQQPDDQPKQAQHTAEDLDNQNLDEEARIGGIRQCGAGAVDADTDAADEVAHADGDAAPEEGVAGVEVGAGVELVLGDELDLGAEDDGHDDAVDGDDLAEDDADQVLGPDPWRLHPAAEDRGPCDEYAPAVAEREG